MNIYLIDVNGFSFAYLNKLVEELKTDEIIDARMNCNRAFLDKFYKTHFLNVRYIIKLANSTYSETYPLEYRKTNIETDYCKGLERFNSLSGETIGVNKLKQYLLNNPRLIEEFGLQEHTNNLSYYLYSDKCDLKPIIASYKQKNKRIDKLTSFRDFEELLYIIKKNISDAIYSRRAMAVDELISWEKYQKESGFITSLEDHVTAHIKDEWEMERDWNQCTLQDFIKQQISDYIFFARMVPEETHFFDVDNIAIFYNNPSYRKKFLYWFAPVDYKYEEEVERIKRFHIHEYGWNDSLEAQHEFAELYETMSREKEYEDEYEYWGVQEIDFETFLEDEEYECEDEEDAKKIRDKRLRWQKEKKRRETWITDIDEGVWIADEKRKQEIMNQLRREEEEGARIEESMWYDPYMQSDWKESDDDELY